MQRVAYLWTYLILNVNLVQQDATIQDIILFAKYMQKYNI
jgi:hypothetical protein